MAAVFEQRCDKLTGWRWSGRLPGRLDVWRRSNRFIAKPCALDENCHVLVADLTLELTRRAGRWVIAAKSHGRVERIVRRRAYQEAILEQHSARRAA